MTQALCGWFEWRQVDGFRLLMKLNEPQARETDERYVAYLPIYRAVLSDIFLLALFSPLTLINNLLRFMDDFVKTRAFI